MEPICDEPECNARATHYLPQPGEYDPKYCYQHAPKGSVQIKAVTPAGRKEGK